MQEQQRNQNNGVQVPNFIILEMGNQQAVIAMLRQQVSELTAENQELKKQLAGGQECKKS